MRAPIETAQRVEDTTCEGDGECMSGIFQEALKLGHFLVVTRVKRSFDPFRNLEAWRNKSEPVSPISRINYGQAKSSKRPQHPVYVFHEVSHISGEREGPATGRLVGLISTWVSGGNAGGQVSRRQSTAEPPLQ
jgi:hypothetical protein